MDTLEHYRYVITNIITEYARLSYAYGEIDRQAVLDTNNDHYLLMAVGWDQGRVHGCVIHVDIIDGKFWIQRDGTEYSVAQELLDVGVPKEHIVAAFKSPDIRQYTGLAVA
jgi:hypothetical protein